MKKLALDGIAVVRYRLTVGVAANSNASVNHTHGTPLP
jgi:hypothetical protein